MAPTRAAAARSTGRTACGDNNRDGTDDYDDVRNGAATTASHWPAAPIIPIAPDDDDEHDADDAPSMGRSPRQLSQGRNHRPRRRSLSCPDFPFRGQDVLLDSSLRIGSTTTSLDDLYTYNHRQRAHPTKKSSSQSPSSSLYHVPILLVVTLLLTVATHRYTFSSLRYDLHSLGTYQMRGVNAQQESSSSHHEQHRLMLPRDYVARSGTKFNFPRGTPLPPPLLALVGVKLCGERHSEARCASLGDVDDGLECAWCEHGEGGCVPADMTGAMCADGGAEAE